MQQTLQYLHSAFAEHEKAALAFSGGGDSTVLLDVIYRLTPYRPVLIWSDSRMEYPDSEQFIRDCATRYGAELLIAQAPCEPLEQWERYGWPMLGKMAARHWQAKHKQQDFRCDVTGCCRRMKIAPARKLLKQRGATLQITGQRGARDDTLRGMRAYKDGVTKFVEADALTICNPLTGWTDLMIRRYIEQNQILQHPAKSRGALTIGCMYCGGGAQFDNSGFRVLRHTEPAAWWRFMVDWRAGEIILAIKHNVSRRVIRLALERLGGLGRVATEKPWVFDFLRDTPLPGYVR